MKQTLCPLLRYYFIGCLLTLAGNLLSSAETGESHASFLRFVTCALTLASLILQLYALAKLRFLGRRMQQAFGYTAISLACNAILCLVLAGSLLSSDELPFSALPFLLLLACTVLALIAAYHFYWGLAEAAVSNDYAFSEGRLHWAFYWKLIAIACVMLFTYFSVPFLPAICTFVFSALSLRILYQFIQTVQEE